MDSDSKAIINIKIMEKRHIKALDLIHSREVYPLTKRPMYQYYLKTKQVQFFVEGKPMEPMDKPMDKTIVSVISKFMAALAIAEKQIKSLIEIIEQSKVEDSIIEEYEKSCADKRFNAGDRNIKEEYHVQELWESLFSAIIRGDRFCMFYYRDCLKKYLSIEELAEVHCLIDERIQSIREEIKEEIKNYENN